MNLAMRYVGKMPCRCTSKELKLDASEYRRVQSSLPYLLLLFVEVQRSCVHRKEHQVQADSLV